MDFMGQSLMAFANNGVSYHNAFGAYWSQALSQSMASAVNDGYEYIFTTDYDSLFKDEDVAELIRLMDETPEADAICSVQVGRFCDLIVSTESGKLNKEELRTKNLVPVKTGHFGLTIIRSSALQGLKKPWFIPTPSSAGDWQRGSDKVDDDIYFWYNLFDSGKKLFLAPRVVIGHLELLIKWPDKDMRGMYGTMENYRSDGPPGDTWK
jgi:hypothetical protein